jgi:L-lactate dehydrogenase complex protein LldF
MWKKGSLSRGMMNMGNGKMKNWMVNKMFKGWQKNRNELHFADKTFNEMWKKRFKS